jgi:TPR repeat protein
MAHHYARRLRTTLKASLVLAAIAEVAVAGGLEEIYRVDAEKGNSSAQFSLGFMYEKGQGVPQDYVQAYMWYNLAATQGTKGAAQWREHIAAHMTPAQIAEAQKMTSEWKPKLEP